MSFCTYQSSGRHANQGRVLKLLVAIVLISGCSIAKSRSNSSVTLENQIDREIPKGTRLAITVDWLKTHEYSIYFQGGIINGRPSGESSLLLQDDLETPLWEDDKNVTNGEISVKSYVVVSLGFSKGFHKYAVFIFDQEDTLIAKYFREIHD